MKYALNISNRKDLVKRLEQLTGTKGVYTRLPRLAYDFDGMSVDKNGNLEVENPFEKLDILETLLSEGLIKGTLPVKETQKNSSSDVSPSLDGELQKETGSGREPGKAAGSSPQTETGGDSEEKKEEAGDLDKAGAKAEERADGQEKFTGKEGEGDSGFIKPNVGFPLAGHTKRTLQNLLSLLYSRGSLISKATGGDFFVSEELMNKVRITDAESLRDILPEDGGEDLKGLVLDETHLIFTGFPPTDDEKEIQAFIQLATLMNKQVTEQNRVQSKRSDESNERYTFRSWLIRLGMKGDDYKEARSILLKRLSGHTAFRTPTDAQRWKIRQRQLREERKEAQLQKLQQEEVTSQSKDTDGTASEDTETKIA